MRKDQLEIRIREMKEGRESLGVCVCVSSFQRAEVCVSVSVRVYERRMIVRYALPLTVLFTYLHISREDTLDGPAQLHLHLPTHQFYSF